MNAPIRKWWKRLFFFLLFSIVGTGLLITAGAFFRDWQEESASGPTAADFVPESQEPTTVRTIRPKRDPNFSMSVQMPADILPYEWANLEAQAAGQVVFIRKAEGASVKAGELLIKIAVPELDQRVLQKQSVVEERRAELKYAEALEKIARTDVDAARKGVQIAEAGVKEAAATLDYRKRVFQRLRDLAIIDKAATIQVVEEYQQNYEAAVAGAMKADAIVAKAKVDLETAQAKFEAARADVRLKETHIEVARKDRDEAQALADYSKVTAPFDGVITQRNVNPGSFVQNASTGRTGTLLRVERRDIVTVRTKIPDNFAPYVSENTEVILELSELPGVQIHGKVTRFAPTLESETHDRSMIVLVDLFNGTEAQYQAFLAKEKAKRVPFDDLIEGPLPLLPALTGKVEAFRRMYPGMYGEMKLIFQQLPDVYLLPSDAVVRSGGVPYVWLVKDGKAVREQADVQFDNRKIAWVRLIVKTRGTTVRRALTGTEDVIYSNQGELTDGDAVKAIPQEWTP